MIMKTEILKYFKEDRSHAGGVALVHKFSHSLALKKQVNIHPQSEYMTGVIHDHLREIAGILAKELQDILRQPVIKQVAAEPPKEVNPPKPTTSRKPRASRSKAKKGPVKPKDAKAKAPKAPAEKKESLKK
jgi:hypothetical protein